ncbi:MAG: hypothetical protein WC686_00670 [Candidatus Shapirobacteria bacterium]|jgi:hypothetical protein
MNRAVEKDAGYSPGPYWEDLGRLKPQVTDSIRKINRNKISDPGLCPTGLFYEHAQGEQVDSTGRALVAVAQGGLLHAALSERLPVVRLAVFHLAGVGTDERHVTLVTFYTDTNNPATLKTLQQELKGATGTVNAQIKSLGGSKLVPYPGN